MSRPRRAASQKVVEQQKLDLSELEETDDDADFSSQSSDDYQPDESKEDEKTFEESESDGINEEIETSEDEDDEPTSINNRGNNR
jgi:hypothetical protein